MKVEVTRTQELEVPQEVTVVAANTSNFESITEYARRASGESVLKSDVSLPIAMSNPRALKAARTGLYSAIAARNAYKFSTTLKYAHLEPGDVVQLRSGAIDARVRIASKDESGGVIQFEATGDLKSAYERDASPLVLPDAPGPVSFGGVIAPVYAHVFDLPRISADFAAPALFVCLTSEDFKGAQVSYAGADGARRSVATVARSPIVGMALSILPTSAKTDHELDDVSFVDVQLEEGVEITVDEMTSAPVITATPANATRYFYGTLATLGPEIIAFGEAEPVAADVVRLRKLRRGLFGTADFKDKHVAWERFAIIKTLHVMPIATTDMGQRRLLSAIPLAGTADDAETAAFTTNDAGTLLRAPTNAPGVSVQDPGWVNVAAGSTTTARRPRVGGYGVPGDTVAVLNGAAEVGRAIVDGSGYWSWSQKDLSGAETDWAFGIYTLAYRYLRGAALGPVTSAASPAVGFEIKAAVAALRYYRLNVLASRGGTGFVAARIDFYDASGARIPTTGATATASSQTSPGTAANGIVADPTKSWYTNVARPNWLRVDFGSPVAVKSFKLDVASSDGGPNQVTSFTLEGSLDGTTWTQLAAASAVPQWVIGSGPIYAF